MIASKNRLRALAALAGYVVMFLAVAVVVGKEVEVTNEWTKLGENDTLPAGVHVRMDMTTGEKFAKQLEKEPSDDSSKETGLVSEAVVGLDGSMMGDSTAEEVPTFDFKLMHRTLSKLPQEEIERMGGIPELPQTEEGTVADFAHRKQVEARLLEIWEKRQAQLKEFEANLLDVPELLKQRKRELQHYLSDPIPHLEHLSIENVPQEANIDNVLSILKDLEYQLSDLDMARDFHTLGGWEILVSVVSEEVHVPENETISSLPPSFEPKIRSIQAHAAWVVGTVVKNTEEFYPFALEKVRIGSTVQRPIDILIETFSGQYDDTSTNKQMTKFLLEKCIYGIGALIRGNTLAQTRLVAKGNSGIQSIGETFWGLVDNMSTASSNYKLIQRLLSLASDVTLEVSSQSETDRSDTESETRKLVLAAFTSSPWCDSIRRVLTNGDIPPVSLQENALTTVEILAPYCHSWKDFGDDMIQGTHRFQGSWANMRDDLDDDYYAILEQLALATTNALGKNTKSSKE